MSNPIAEELRAIIDGDEDTLAHYGVKRRSGRYPYGSGDDPYQHGRDFLGRVEELKKTGWKETPENIMNEFGLTTTQYRVEKSLAKDERRMLLVDRAKALKKDGLGDTEIGRQMGVNESTVRSWLNENSEARMKQAQKTADALKKLVDEKGMIDVGASTHLELGVSQTKMKEALYILERDGYYTFKNGIPQATNPGKQTNQVVLCPPGTPYKINDKGQRVSSAVFDFANIHSIKDYTSHDDGETFDTFVYPKSMDSKRMKIRYNEEGGLEKDGIVEIRRGVEDLSLGDSRYSQVRILVDDTKYIKGVAVYSDDMPPGVDVIFNTNKPVGTPMGKVLKDIKTDKDGNPDPDNPFGSLIKPNGQNYYIDKDGNRQLGLINKRADEGDWSDWSNALPSQFLGKQNKALAERQLNLAKADKQAEFKEICELNNPTVKKHMLEEFASDCDAAAVHLKAAALPGQKYHVIIPINSLKDNEIYAPNYENGTQLALVRYPHAGTFEIPILTVNNRHAPAKNIIGEHSIDAVGITKSVADRLSGADFDGDTVMCIPTNTGRVRITSTIGKDSKLDELRDFDPKMAYPERPGMRYMKDPVTGVDNTQIEMGVISNLITDMTLAGANSSDLAKAVKHSMVVIDAGKHKLDYKQSEKDNDIARLKREYQIKPDGTTGGASTVLSRAKGQASVPKRQGTPYTNQKGKPWYDPNRPEGALIYKTADDVEYTVTRTNKRTGATTTTTRTRTQKSTQMAETDDAMTLVSANKHPMELLYADYANSMKSLANQARMEIVNTKDTPYSATAKATYNKEVKDLDAKLAIAELNRPRERAAQRKTNAAIQAKIQANPDMSKSDIKKAKNQAINKYRKEVGSVSRKDRNIEITDREWEAIQAGAISATKLRRILKNADADKLRERATPRASTTLSPAKINKIKAMSTNSNYSLAEIAAACGCSTTTVSKYLKGQNQ